VADGPSRVHGFREQTTRTHRNYAARQGTERADGLPTLKIPIALKNCMKRRDSVCLTVSPAS